LPVCGFGWICPFWAGFATKAQGRKVFLLALLSSKKAQSRVFLSLCWVLAKTPGRKVFLFLPVKRNLLLKTAPLPEVSGLSAGNPFSFFFKKQKIASPVR
jgi:hypothetical protein